MWWRLSWFVEMVMVGGGVLGWLGMVVAGFLLGRLVCVCERFRVCFGTVALLELRWDVVGVCE